MLGAPDTSVRSTSVFTKNPTRSSSALSVRPAIGLPSAMSLPPPSRLSSPTNPACSTMNRLAPPERPTRKTPASIPPPKKKLGRDPPPPLALAAQHLLLPQRVVRILHRKRRKPRCLPRTPRPIAARNIPPQPPPPPPPPRNVMQHQQQPVLARAEPIQMRPQRRLTIERKLRPRSSCQHPRKLFFPHLHDRKRRPHPARVADLLPRYPVALRKHRAQALVPLHHIPERSLQRPHIQLPRKPHRTRNDGARTVPP